VTKNDFTVNSNTLIINCCQLIYSLAKSLAKYKHDYSPQCDSTGRMDATKRKKNN